MATVPPQQVGVFASLTTSEPSEPDGPLGVNYYLTEGLEGEEHQRYRDGDSFRLAIALRAKELRSGNTDESTTPYLIFSPVMPHQLPNIERIRDNHYKTLRFLYLDDPRTLIVKIMPSVPHESTTREFEKAFDRKLVTMGLGNALASLGSATYKGNSSRKQADASFKPRSARHDDGDWPTMVVECGVSGSARRLKVDARWWLDNSLGEVRIGLLFYVSKKAKTIRIQSWKMDTLMNPHVTRGHPTLTRPTIENTIQIVNTSTVTTITKKGEVVPGGELTLDFERIFLRKPTANGEGNITFTEQDLKTFYSSVLI